MVHGVNNNFLLGDFGKMSFFDAESGEGAVEYDAFRIELHYQSEHKINGNSYDAELVVYHASKSSFTLKDIIDKYNDIGLTLDQEFQMMSEATDLIVSFLVQVDPLRTTDDDGLFWSAFKYTNPPEKIPTSRFNVQSVITIPTDGNRPKVTGDKDLYNLEGLIKGGVTS